MVSHLRLPTKLKALLRRAGDRFYNQSSREQWLLLLGTVCVMLYMVYFFVMVPFAQRLDLEQRQTQALQETLVSVQGLAGELYGLQQNQSRQQRAPVTNIAQLIDRSLRAHGLTMRGFQPGADGQAQLRLDNVAYSHVLRWLYDIEVRQQVVIKELSLVRGQAPGMVAANIRLYKE